MPTARSPKPILGMFHRTGLDRLGLFVCLSLGLFFGIGYALTDVKPTDAAIFWSAGQSAHYYGLVWGVGPDSLFVYPPPLAQILGVIPWQLFLLMWIPLIFVSLWITTRRWSFVVIVVSTVALVVWGFGNPLANPVMLAGLGNPQSVVAAAILLGFRWPAAWGLVVLTKIGPGIGLLWFAVRREWHNLGIALLATGVVVALSAALAPNAWLDFFRFAINNAGAAPPVSVLAVPLPVRITMSALLIIWGGLHDHKWTVPIAAGWASLALYDSSAITMWLAALVLVDWPLPRARRILGLPTSHLATDPRGSL